MVKGVLKVATCQFAVSASIKRNAQQIQGFMQRAGRTRADIVHFPECALSGYAGPDLANFDGFDWELLKAETLKIMALARKYGLWVVLGSTHRLTPDKNIRGQALPNKPHNSLYLINPKGQIVDRYDKRFCTPDDLKNYTPGNHFVNFTVNGVNCALLICFDLRFPELYRQLRKLNVDFILQSFYNARQKAPSAHTYIMRQTMQCRAATNYFWISLANSSGYYSPYPSCFIAPDGRIVKHLRQNRSGIMVNTVDINKKLYDPSAPFRDMAIAGKLSNATKIIRDNRSTNRTTIF